MLIHFKPTKEADKIIEKIIALDPTTNVSRYSTFTSVLSSLNCYVSTREFFSNIYYVYVFEQNTKKSLSFPLENCQCVY